MRRSAPKVFYLKGVMGRRGEVIAKAICSPDLGEDTTKNARGNAATGMPPFLHPAATALASTVGQDRRVAECPDPTPIRSSGRRLDSSH